MRALVTGAAGFIGSHISERLVHEGYEVVGLDNLSTGKYENLKTIAAKIEFVEGDIRDKDLLSRLIQGCEHVFHQAAIVSVPYSVAHPEESHSVNLEGTLGVLVAARDAGVRRVVFASSAAVYGDAPALPKSETMRPAPISPYGVEKLAAEAYCALFNKLYPLEAVALRYFNVFGPRQDPSSPYSGVISIFVDRLLSGRTATIYGDGTQTRDFVFVSDVVEACIRAATQPAAAGTILNIGCGKQISLLALIDSLRALRPEATLAVEHAAPRDGDIKHSLASIDRARELIGYAPAITVEDGLEQLLASF